ncbi:MAG: hypothetical protein K6A14_02435 [Erysipelotrichaceae bacterium]|nr:hypothetical protein [Erysipelotrichaceae bacterium]
MRYSHTNRNGFLIGAGDFCTAGLLLFFWMPGGLQQEIEEVLGHKVMEYRKAYLLGIPTLFIYTLVWMARVAEELKQKALELGVEGKLTSYKHMFFWNLPGVLTILGPAIATDRFFDTLNKVERKMNAVSDIGRRETS